MDVKEGKTLLGIYVKREIGEGENRDEAEENGIKGRGKIQGQKGTSNLEDICCTLIKKGEMEK